MFSYYLSLPCQLSLSMTAFIIVLLRDRYLVRKAMSWHFVKRTWQWLKFCTWCRRKWVKVAHPELTNRRTHVGSFFQFSSVSLLISEIRNESTEQHLVGLRVTTVSFDILSNVLTQWKCYICFRAGCLCLEWFTKIHLIWEDKCKLYIRLFNIFFIRQSTFRLWPIFCVYVGQISSFSTLKNPYKQTIVSEAKDGIQGSYL